MGGSISAHAHPACYDIHAMIFDTHQAQAETLAVSVAEAGRLLGISRRHCYHLVHSGDIPTIRLGERIVVPRAGLNRLLAGGDHDAPAQD
jgi:excisionase family DNA binding protein